MLKKKKQTSMHSIPSSQLPIVERSIKFQMKAALTIVKLSANNYTFQALVYSYMKWG